MLLPRLSRSLAAAPRWKRRGLALLALACGLALGWRASLAHGTACDSGPLDGQTFTASCVPRAWHAWWQAPGLALAALLVVGATLVLSHAWLEERAERGRRKGRRARVGGSGGRRGAGN